MQGRIGQGLAAGGVAAVLLIGGGAPARAAGSCQTIVTAAGAGSAASCPGASALAVVRPGPVTWCYQVRNTGDAALSGITVLDSVFGALPGTLGDLSPGDVSAPLAFSGESLPGVHSAQATATASASASGGGGTLRCTPGEVGVVQATPGIAFSFTVAVDGGCPGRNEVVVSRGTDITYCYEVTNPDSVTTLSGIQVTHDLFGPDPVGAVDALAPGATRMLTATRPMLMHDQTSFATAIGAPVFGQQVFPAVTVRSSVVADVQ